VGQLVPSPGAIQKRSDVSLHHRGSTNLALHAHLKELSGDYSWALSTLRSFFKRAKPHASIDLRVKLEGGGTPLPWTAQPRIACRRHDLVGVIFVVLEVNRLSGPDAGEFHQPSVAVKNGAGFQKQH